MDYVDLPIVDLSKAATPKGRALLADLAKQAMIEYGFFYVISHGYTTEQMISRTLEPEVINVGDVAEFLTGGLYRATRHRTLTWQSTYQVTQPPPDQRGHTRAGAFYFAFPDDSTPLSPVLQRVGIRYRFEDEKAPTAEQWHKVRISSYGPSDVTKKDEQLITGVDVKHYYN
ncbi:hypothetical protein AN958_02194 [Leucoagaricus sp. SymC.cos]|nr:hypothetical protein AN958_02194 [Leucoagaricus sp. SymC.cos]